MTDASGATGSGQGTGGDASQQNGQQGTQGGDQQQQAAGQQGTQQQGTQAQGTQGQEAAGDAYLAQRFPGFASFPAEAQAALRARDGEARRYQAEAGDQRINAKNEANRDGQRKALAEVAKLAGLKIPGLTDGDGDADPKVLAAQITTANGERDAARLDATMLRQAVAAGAAPDKLDYLAFKLSQSNEYRQIDPNAADASAKVRASIDAALAQDATLRQTGTVQVSGVENHGGSNGADAITPDKFKAMTIQERQDLYFKDQAQYDRLVAAQ